MRNTILMQGAIATTSVLLTVAGVHVRPAHADWVTYDFVVTVSEGSLAGKTFYGTFSYDDSFLTGIGTESLGVAQGLTVSMNFLGQTYTETDDVSYPNFPTLVFEDGEIQQLDFWLQPSPRANWWDLPGWTVDRSRQEF